MKNKKEAEERDRKKKNEQDTPRKKESRIILRRIIKHWRTK